MTLFRSIPVAIFISAAWTWSPQPIAAAQPGAAGPSACQFRSALDGADSALRNLGQIAATMVRQEGTTHLRIKPVMSHVIPEMQAAARSARGSSGPYASTAEGRAVLRLLDRYSTTLISAARDFSAGKLTSGLKLSYRAQGRLEPQLRRRLNRICAR